jgi:hypothetical protein
VVVFRDMGNGGLVHFLFFVFVCFSFLFFYFAAAKPFLLDDEHRSQILSRIKV